MSELHGISQTVLRHQKTLVCLQIASGLCYKQFQLGERAHLSQKILRPHIWNQLIALIGEQKQLKMSIRSEHLPFFGGNTA